MVEQCPCKAMVEGSNPSDGLNYLYTFGVTVNITVSKSVDKGSIPLAYDSSISQEDLPLII